MPTEGGEGRGHLVVAEGQGHRSGGILWRPPAQLVFSWFISHLRIVGRRFYINNSNNNTSICKAHNVSIRAESEAPWSVELWSGVECLCVFAGKQQALAAHSCNSTLKHMINKIRRDSQVFERSVISLSLVQFCYYTRSCYRLETKLEDPR